MKRLDAIRGPGAPVDHNARSIAALAANPACDRRAILDAAGIDKAKTVERLGHSSQFGQSPFALARSRQFNARVKAHGGAAVLRLLREHIGLPVEEAGYHDVEDVAGDTAHGMRYLHTKQVLNSAATNPDGAATLFDHPLLKLRVAGHDVYLEPDVIAFRVGARFHVVAIKSFPVLDEQADAAKVTAAAREAAVYVHALREMFGRLGLDPARVSHDVVLICPQNFGNFPTAGLVDVRHQLEVLRRQLSRLAAIEAILARLPQGLSLDLEQSPAQLLASVSAISARYAPECLAACELAYFCRAEARDHGSLDALGRSVRDDFGGLESIDAALALIGPAPVPAADQRDVADRLRYLRRVYDEVVA